MEGRLESYAGPQVVSPSQAIDDFAKQTRLRQRQWAQCLADDADVLANIEQEIDWYYRQGAGHLVAALLAQVTARPILAQTSPADPTRSGCAAASTPTALFAGTAPVWFGVVRQHLVLRAARWQTRHRTVGRATGGVYPELAALGFGKG